MFPSSFEESNIVFDTPAGVDPDDITPIAAFKGSMGNHPVSVTCWKPTPEEIEIIKNTGRVWLILVMDGMVPALVTAFKPNMIVEASDDRENPERN